MKFKSILLILFLVISYFSAYPQRNSFVIDSEFLPLSLEELYKVSQMNQRAAIISAYDRKIKEQEFISWLNKAINSYNNHFYHDCITFSKYALDTKFENDYIYLLRGLAYEQLYDFKNAKKEYKKSKKLGNSEAKVLLSCIKQREKSWKESQKHNKHIDKDGSFDYEYLKNLQKQEEKKYKKTHKHIKKDDYDPSIDYNELLKLQNQ